MGARHGGHGNSRASVKLKMRQCQRLTIWSSCPTYAKTKTGRWDPRLTSFVRGPVLSNSVCTGIQVLPKCYRDPPYPNFLRGSTDAGQKSGILQLPNGDPQMTFDQARQRQGRGKVCKRIQKHTRTRLLLPLHRESELFIGTQFSILYTFMHSPA